jgi:hypothetical protein
VRNMGERGHTLHARWRHATRCGNSLILFFPLPPLLPSYQPTPCWTPRHVFSTYGRTGVPADPVRRVVSQAR